MPRPFEALYVITCPDDKTYAAVKDAMLKDFAKSKGLDPYFDPLITFDDTQLKINSGYEYDTLFTAIPRLNVKGSELNNLLPALAHNRAYEAFQDNEDDTVVMENGIRLTRASGNPYAERRRCVAEAEARFSALPAPYELLELPPALQANEVLPWLVKDNSLVAMGETHTEQSARLQLASFLPEFKKLGGKYIYFENLRTSQQPLLDAYFEDPERPLPIEIVRWIKSSEAYLQSKFSHHIRSEYWPFKKKSAYTVSIKAFKAESLKKAAGMRAGAGPGVIQKNRRRLFFFPLTLMRFQVFLLLLGALFFGLFFLFGLAEFAAVLGGVFFFLAARLGFPLLVEVDDFGHALTAILTSLTHSTAWRLF